MMLGEINYDDLYYPARMQLQPNYETSPNITFQIPNFEETTFTFPKMNEDSDFVNEKCPVNSEAHVKMPSYKEFMKITVPQFTGYTNISIANFTNGDVITSPKPTFFPITANIMILIFAIFVSIVVINLLVGLAVADVQVSFKILTVCISTKAII